VDERRLYLLRHAKSSWKDEGLADHDRPLARRGRRAAKAIGRHLREQAVEPELYGAGPAELLARLRELEAKFPTGALATLAFRGPGWAALDRGTAELIEFIRPRDLD
jgi:phosphohistidine phosphatase SixA